MKKRSYNFYKLKWGLALLPVLSVSCTSNPKTKAEASVSATRGMHSISRVTPT